MSQYLTRNAAHVVLQKIMAILALTTILPACLWCDTLVASDLTQLFSVTLRKQNAKLGGHQNAFFPL